jgi:hypothetical protein
VIVIANIFFKANYTIFNVFFSVNEIWCTSIKFACKITTVAVELKSYSEIKVISSIKSWVCHLGRRGGGVMVSNWNLKFIWKKKNLGHYFHFCDFCTTLHAACLKVVVAFYGNGVPSTKCNSWACKRLRNFQLCCDLCFAGAAGSRDVCPKFPFGGRHKSLPKKWFFFFTEG